ncbi:MAG TPA: phosphoribosyl-AMP cyclohydrolase [Euzebyales bacterium]
MDPSRLRYDERGLIPAIVQQHDTGEVLMMAWMSATTVHESLDLGETVFWSRSRAERWHKGATSGNTQTIVSMTADCDADVLLIAVDQQGSGACHTGARTCFHRELSAKVGGERRAGGGGEDDGDV